MYNIAMRKQLMMAAVLLFPLVASGMTLDDLVVGNTVHGPKLSLEDMRGKVVLVEYWGTR